MEEEEILENSRGSKKSFALIVRGYPEDFDHLVQLAKVNGLYVIYMKTSHLRLVVEEVAF